MVCRCLTRLTSSSSGYFDGPRSSMWPQWQHSDWHQTEPQNKNVMPNNANSKYIYVVCVMSHNWYCVYFWFSYKVISLIIPLHSLSYQYMNPIAGLQSILIRVWKFLQLNMATDKNTMIAVLQFLKKYGLKVSLSIFNPKINLSHKEFTTSFF